MCVCGDYMGLVAGFYEEGNTGMYDATSRACVRGYAPGACACHPGQAIYFHFLFNSEI